MLDTTDSRQASTWRDWCENKCKLHLSVSGFLCREGTLCADRTGLLVSDLLHLSERDNYNAAGNALIADLVICRVSEEPPSRHRS